MLTDVTVSLLRRTSLLPGESLPSLLERLAQLNHYSGISVLNLLCQAQQASPLSQDQPACPLFGATFLRLAHLTQLPVVELWAASAHRFTPTLTPAGGAPTEPPWLAAPTRPRALPTLARLHLRPATTAQYCPVCLQGTPYHQLNWMPVAATLCLEHQCLLVDRCPGCQQPVTIADVVRRRCRICRTELSTAAAVLVTGDDLGLLAQQMIQFWFAVAPAPKLDAGRQLPAQSPALLYRLLAYLSRRLLSCRVLWPTWPTPVPSLDEHAARLGSRSHHLTPNQTYELWRAAFTGLVEWPQGLFRFLDAYSRRTRPAMTRMHRTNHLTTIQKDWLAPAWRAADNDFCIQAFVDYLCDRKLPFSATLVKQLEDVDWFVDKTGLWTERRVAQALELARQDLRRFHPLGTLGPCLWPLKYADASYFDRAKVLAVQQRWQATHGWSVLDASSWLGLDEAAVLLLVARGLLTPLPGSAQSPHCVFDRQTVMDFFDRVATRVIFPKEEICGLMNLDAVVHYFSYRALDPATLLQGVIDGTLQAYRRHPELPALSYLCFVEMQLLRRCDAPLARPGWVRDVDFARGSNLPWRTIQGWVDAGLIQPQAGTDCYFEMQRLEELTAAHRAAL